jgi:hypothetical protein
VSMLFILCLDFTEYIRVPNQFLSCLGDVASNSRLRLCVF